MVDRKNIPGLISRKAWGAEHPDGFGDRPLPVTEWWLHHSVTFGPDTLPPFTDDDAAIRTLERIGQNRFGGGISYTVPITPSGRGYVGHSFWRRGAHTQGHNTVAAAICFVGDYEANEPTDAMIREAARVMVEARRLGLATRHTLNGGHRDTKSTACPGRKAYAAIGRINALAEQLWDRRDDGASRDGDKRPVIRGYVRRGDKGNDVGDVQRALVKAGLLLEREVDEDFGPKTERAVKAAQRRKKLDDDGIVGPDFCRAYSLRWVKA